jgi:predicted dinucleotide-binding enzyme
MTTIGTIGAGHIGTAVARLALATGHQVVLSNSRGPETLAGLVAELGAGASAETAEGAAARGDLVVVTIPVKAIDSVPVAPLAGKVVIDTNNYYPQRDGQIAELDSGELGSSELLARMLPGAKVVKAFNTIYYKRLSGEGRPRDAGDRLAIPLAGDDTAAKQLVAGLIDDMGFDPVDAGSLADGRNQQPGTPAYNNPVGAAGVRQALGIG